MILKLYLIKRFHFYYKNAFTEKVENKDVKKKHTLHTNNPKSSLPKIITVNYLAEGKIGVGRASDWGNMRIKGDVLTGPEIKARIRFLNSLHAVLELRRCSASASGNAHWSAVTCGTTHTVTFRHMPRGTHSHVCRHVHTHPAWKEAWGDCVTLLITTKPLCNSILWVPKLETFSLPNQVYGVTITLSGLFFFN